MDVDNCELQPARLNPERARIVAELQQAGWLKKVEWYEQIDSTNTHARRLLANDNLPRPALLVADEQTNGRGRSDRAWWSPAGCLMFTLVVDSSAFLQDSADVCPLALLCGVGLAEAVSHLLGSNACQLKWPNDLYLNGKKLAGILIESVRPASSTTEPVWIIGVGLNVNIDWKQAPDEVRSRAICLSQASGEHHQVEDVLVEVIAHLKRWLDGASGGNLHWLEGWTERCLLTGKNIAVRQGHPSLGAGASSLVEGRCEGVDQMGRLLVRRAGELQALSIGEVVAWDR
jgi:BirA family transcriptional regulator, biotin operon repressor / biotin---[acetyl-CoA-carboxylase] ligase